jgi:hypothetical protein
MLNLVDGEVKVLLKLATKIRGVERKLNPY